MLLLNFESTATGEPAADAAATVEPSAAAVEATATIETAADAAKLLLLLKLLYNT